MASVPANATPQAASRRRAICFSDFDGTVRSSASARMRLQHETDWMTDNLGFGEARRRVGNVDILSGKVGFRDAFRTMLESINENHTFEECRKLVTEAITLDEGFKPFLEWTKTQDVPVIIVSSGMVPIIKSIFSNLVGDEEASKIAVIANDVEILPDGHFKVKYRHPDSHYGHDKSKALEPYANLPAAERPIIFFCGDGVSDMSAAASADVLFVKIAPDSHNDLADHCHNNKIPFLPFLDFTQVKEKVQEVLEGKITVKDIQAGLVRNEDVEAQLKKMGKSFAWMK